MASTSTSDMVGASMDQPSTSKRDGDEKEMDEHSQFEILHAIERFLEGGKFGRAAAALRRDINERKLVPARTDFEGANHDRNYRQFLSSLSHLPSTSRFTANTLPSMISRLATLSDRAVAPPVKGLKLRLITNKRSALHKNNDVLLPAHRPNLIHGNRGHVAVLKTKHSPIELLRARELGSRVPISLLPPERSYELMDRHFRILGHLANVFCVAFDRTENYLITGADDNLVKVWNVNQAMLKFTYRGHSAELVDLTVSHCNQLVASCANDKMLRVWKLQNGETMFVFKNHSASVTSVLFLPFTGSGVMRYLVSTGNDCFANFYRFNQETLEFPVGLHNREGLVYHGYERDQPGAKMLITCHSEGGHIVIIGESHGVIRVYRMHEDGVEKVKDIAAHTDRVDSLMWAHKDGLRFCSGSKDGTAKIWRFQYGEWQQTVLALSQSELIDICGVNATQNNPNSKNKYKVSMVCWTLDNSRVATTGSDHSYRIWDSTTGSQLMRLYLHTDDAFHMFAHPIHSHLILSSGHDGVVNMTDVVRGVVVHKWMNTIEQGEMGAIFDIGITKDATRFVIADNKGHISLYGLGTNKRKQIREQFFSNDYAPIVIDDNGFALDEQTGIAPHLMPPQQLVTVNLDVHAADIQAMIPGRDTGEEVDEADLVCAWLSRDIVPKIGHNEMESWAERQLILNNMESEEYINEMGRERPSPSPTPDAIVPFSRRVNVRASRPTSFRAAITAENAMAQARTRENVRSRTSEAQRLAMLRRDVSMRYIGIEPNMNGQGAAIAFDNDDDDMDSEEEEVEEEEAETDTSDTDYDSDDGRRERRREREREREASWTGGTSTRPRRREREVEEEMEESSQHSRPERKTRRRGLENEFGDDLSIDMFDLPSTSTGRRRGGRDVTQERTERSNGRKKRTPKIEDRDEEEVDDIEMEEERSTVTRLPKAAWKLSFPDWMRDVKRKRFPYVAQIGDHVVYFRQGHEHYLNEVEKTKLYVIDNKMRPKSDIDCEEFAVVDDIKYVLRPYRLTQLKLARIDSAGRRTGLEFIVKYHDLDNVPDFIIYKAFYDEAIAMGLDVGDEVEAAIDDKWWCGTVENPAVKNPLYPNSHWQCVSVMWMSGDDDAVSPWDLRKRSAGTRTDHPVTEEDSIALGSVPYSDGDWPEGDENGEAIRRRIKRALNELGETDTVKVFNNPVDIQEYPDYPTKVAYPMDLQTICERIDNQYYRRLRSLLQDIRYIARSAETYNLKDSIIVRNAKVFVEAVIRLANDSSIEDVLRFYDSCHDLTDAELIEYRRKSRPEGNPEMIQLLREQEDALGNDGEDNGPRRPGWIRDAVEVLEELMRQECARHFKSADDEDEEMAPVWETCDDLETLCAKVRDGVMANPKEIEIAVHSLVSTVKSSIENRRSEIYKNSVSLQSHFNNRFKIVLSKFESTQASVQAQLGVPLERSMRKRARDAPQHAYNTRRSDHNALLAVAHATADYDQPSSSRSAARHERGFYRTIANGGGGGRYGSEEMEVTSSSSRRSATGGRRSTRNAPMRMEEEEEEMPLNRRPRLARRTMVDDDTDLDVAPSPAAPPIIPSDDEMMMEEDNEEEEEEEEEEEAEDSDDEEYSVSQSKKNKKGRKRRAESDESATASTSTASSTRRSARKKKPRRMTSDEDDEEEEDTPRGRGAKKKGSSRPTRSSNRHSQQNYDERSDDEDEDEGRATPSISQRGRQRRPTRFAD